MDVACLSGLPHEVADLILRADADPIKRPRGIEAFERALARMTELDRVSTHHYRYGGYVIQAGLTPWLTKQVRALDLLQGLGLTIAPEVVARAEVGEEEWVLVTRYRASLAVRLVPVAQVSGRFSSSVRERFMEDVRSLASRHLVHDYAYRGYESWLVAIGSGAIVLEDWGSALRPTSEADIPEVMDDFMTLLDSKQ